MRSRNRRSEVDRRLARVADGELPGGIGGEPLLADVPFSESVDRSMAPAIPRTLLLAEPNLADLLLRVDVL